MTAPTSTARDPRAGFRRYETAVSDVTREEIFRDCNRRMYGGYGPDPGREPRRPQAYPTLAYLDLLRRLAAMPHVEVVTLRDLCLRPDGGDRVRLAIRHDVDGDIVAALEMAKLEARLGLPTSYYVLHTAAYHGVFRGGVLHRHAGSAGVYREIEALGHEIGLHTDGLTVYQQHGVDGAEAVEHEIAWLREQGLDVTGTVAHGSKSVFGAENYEIFRGRRKGRPRDRSGAADGPDLLEFAGTRAWLRVVDEDALGLVYEGNDVFRQEDVRVEYGATRTVDGWRWNADRRRRRDAPPPAGPEFCVQEEMLRDVERLEPGCCVVLTVHPCYFGARHDPAAAPPLRRRRVTIEIGTELGWPVFAPGRVQSWCDADDADDAVHDAAPDHQAFSVANEIGMLDVRHVFAAERRAAMRRVLVLDGGALDGRDVAMPSQCHRVLEEMIEQATGCDAACLKLAHQGTGIDRLGSWCAWGLARFAPNVVVLGITSRALREATPAVWSVETGFSRRHPPGDYLDVRDGRVVVVPRSRRWAIRRRRPRPVATWPGTDVPTDDVLGRDDRLRTAGADARARLVALYRHVVEGVRGAGARCVLLITESGETAGWDPARRDGAWADVRQAVFRRHVESIAAATETLAVDPRPAFPPSNACHADGSWTAEAHRVAARVLFDAMNGAGLLG